MKKIITAGILGGILYFAWGALSWMVFPWHTATMSKLPNEDVVLESMRQNVTAPGAYFFPFMPENHNDPAACEAYNAKYKQGPVGFMVYAPGGKEMDMAPQMARGLAIDIASALILAYLLTLKAPGTYGCRLTFVILIGLFTSLTTHAMYWNWMSFPCNYTLAMTLDVVGGWTLAGLVMAAVIKPAGGQTAMSSLAGVVEPG